MKQLRKSISLLLFYALLIEVVSGVVLYIGPLPRIASTMEWSLLWLSKASWEAVHTLFGFVMVIAGIAHIILNSRAIISYIRCRIHGHITRSFIAATLITLMIGYGTVVRWEPFNTLLDYGESLRRGWAIDMIRQRTDLVPPEMRAMMLQRLQRGTPAPANRASNRD